MYQDEGTSIVQHSVGLRPAKTNGSPEPAGKDKEGQRKEREEEIEREEAWRLQHKNTLLHAAGCHACASLHETRIAPLGNAALHPM